MAYIARVRTRRRLPDSSASASVAEPTPDEVALLAELWWVAPEGLRRSIEEARANR